MLAWRRELTQLGVHVVGRRRRARRAVRGIERQPRRAGERRAHHHHALEHVGPRQRTPRGHRRSEVVADHAGQRAVAQRRGQRQQVADAIEGRERRQVVVELHLGAAAAPVAALVGRHHVEAGLGQRQHHLAPAVGQLREAVDQQQPRPVAALVAGLEDVHRDAVDAGDDPRADARGQRTAAERPGRGRLRGDAARHRGTDHQGRRGNSLHPPSTSQVRHDLVALNDLSPRMGSDPGGRPGRGIA